METSENVNIGPIIINPERSDDLGGNWKTKLYEEQGGKIVLKVDQRIAIEMPRMAGETDEDYYKRRLQACMDFAQREMHDEKILKSYVPEGMHAPGESWLIIDGDDGFPVAARAQKKVEGKMIKDTDFDKLSDQNHKDLKALVDASIKCYLSTGKVFDLTGWSGEDEGRYRWLRLSITKPIEGSSNIFVNDSGDLVLIDLKSSFPGGSIARKIGRFIHFAGLVAYKLKEEIKNYNR